MRNLLLMAIAILLCTDSFAQTATTKKDVRKKFKHYCCPKCDYCTSKKGICPHDKAALVVGQTEIKYCCSLCDWTIPPVKGQCPHSTASLYKEGTLFCVYCHDKDGKCTKCGMDMKKVEIKKK